MFRETSNTTDYASHLKRLRTWNMRWFLFWSVRAKPTKVDDGRFVISNEFDSFRTPLALIAYTISGVDYRCCLVVPLKSCNSDTDSPFQSDFLIKIDATHRESASILLSMLNSEIIAWKFKDCYLLLINYYNNIKYISLLSSDPSSISTYVLYYSVFW